MKYLFFIMCLCQLGRLAAQDAPDFTVRPNSKSVVKLIYRNNLKTSDIFSYVSSILPLYKETRIEDSLAPGSGEKYLVYELAAPQTGMFLINRVGGLIYLVPNDTATISVDLHNNRSWPTYEFSGRYSAINRYYFEQGKVLKAIPSDMHAYFANESPSLLVYKNRMDSLLRVEKQFLATYHAQHPLPAWFLKDEQLRISYSDASSRANTLHYRRFLRKGVPEKMPPTYFSFVTPSLVNNSKAIHLVDYARFVNDYFIYLADKQKAGKNIIVKADEQANTYLTGEAWEMFMTEYIDELLAAAPTTGEALLARYYPKFRNKKLIDELKRYYQDAYTLKPGESAPKFALEDKLDSLVYLKEFQGQVIYLGFWFTGCAPCRMEMPLENELVTYFKDKPVKLISICVQSARDDWAKVSKLYNLQTVNLFANKAWEKTLISKYNVKSYPHYVLIDKEGKVVKNNCGRPSTTAKQEIEAVLNAN